MNALKQKQVSIQDFDMMRQGEDDGMSPEEYRAVVQRLGGRIPPCISCGDDEVVSCMETGFECARFRTFVDRTVERGGN